MCYVAYDDRTSVEILLVLGSGDIEKNSEV